MAATKIITAEELKSHSDASSVWIAINDNVYDVTKFLDEHPGGEEVLLEQAGGYATESFEDVGHSSDARELMKDYLVGQLAEKDREKPPAKKKATTEDGSSSSGSWSSWLVPLGIAICAALLYRYVMSPTSAS